MENKLSKKKTVILHIGILIISLLGSIFASLIVNYSVTIALKKSNTVFWDFDKEWVIGSIIIFILFVFILEIMHFSKKERSSTGKTKTHATMKLERAALKELDNIPLAQKIMLDKKLGFPISTLAMHTLIMGKTGAGKTETFKKLLSELENKDPNSVTIIIDGKGDVGLIKDLGNKDTFVWEFGKGISWNPISDDDEGTIVSKLSTFFGNHEYFKGRGMRHLEYIIKLIKIAQEDLNVSSIFENMSLESFKKLQERAFKKYSSEFIDKKDMNRNSKEWRALEQAKRWIEREVKEQDITGMSDAIYNIYSPIQDDLGSENSLLEIISKHKRVIFSLNSLKYGEQAKMIGRLLVQDLKELAVIKDRNLKINIFLDELNVFISNDLVNLINKSRSYGYRMFLAFQTIADLKVDNIDLKDIIFGNVNNIIAHESPSNDTKEYISRLFGTREVEEMTSQVDHKTGNSDKGSKKIIDEFKIHPNTISNLKIGTAAVRISLPSGNKVVDIVNVQMVKNWTDKKSDFIVKKTAKEIDKETEAMIDAEYQLAQEKQINKEIKNNENKVVINLTEEQIKNIEKNHIIAEEELFKRKYVEKPKASFGIVKSIDEEYNIACFKCNFGELKKIKARYGLGRQCSNKECFYREYKNQTGGWKPYKVKKTEEK